MFLGLSSCYITTVLFANLLLTSIVSGQTQQVCDTPECKKLSEEIQRNRNLSVNPCDDFYEYACGSWKIHNPMPPHEVSWSALQIMQETVDKRLKDLLLAKVKKTDIPPVKAMKQLYQSCMNIEEIDANGVKPIIELLAKTGGWPLLMPLGTWDPRDWFWQDIERVHIRILGQSLFYKFVVENDETNIQNMILTIQRHIEFPWMQQVNSDQIWFADLNNPKATGILQVIYTFAKEMGYQLDKVKLYYDILNMVTFEWNLERIYNNIPVNAIKDTMSLQDLQNEFNSFGLTIEHSKFNFINVVTYLMKSVNISIDPSYRVAIYDKGYYLELAKLFEVTPIETIVNYLQWNFVYSLLNHATSEMGKIKFDFLNFNMGVSGYPPRWLSCLRNLQLKDAASYMYVKEYFSDEVAQKTSDMIEAIKDEIIKLASKPQPNPKEVPDAIRTFMVEKYQNMKSEIGFPKWYNNDTAMIEHYSQFSITKSYFKNARNYNKFEFDVQLKDVFKLAKDSLWAMQPTSRNAYYNSIINTIVIPAAELIEPAFTKSMPEAYNYGSVGSVIGHELGHSIDNLSIGRDKAGVSLMWNYYTFLPYTAKNVCFTNQYNQYILDAKDIFGNTMILDGSMTLSENIAENVALRSAYNAMKEVGKKKNSETKLIGLESMSEDELFFLSYANMWCTEERPALRTANANRFRHSPPKYRVIGAVSNIPEFTATFKCPPGSPMNPPQKCNLLQ